MMNRLEKAFLIFLTISLVVVNLHPMAWGEEKQLKNDPSRDELNLLDLLIVRPLGVVGWIFGTGVFIASLPITIPAGKVDEAAKMFVHEPFKFSFVREFPDENL